MKTRTVRTVLRVCFGCGLAVYLPAAVSLSAATLYVSLYSTNPSPPYTTWPTAATDIQAAVDAAQDGDTVLVTNGVYTTGARDLSLWNTSASPPRMMPIWPSRVVVTNAIRLESVNGPGVTFVDGGARTNAGGEVTPRARCVYLGDGAVLSGFTLTNGLAYPLNSDGGWDTTADGGGVLAAPSAVVTNCVLTGCAANRGGGIYGAILYNCVLTNNVVITQPMFMFGNGGGACGSTLYHCLLAGNKVGRDGSTGGASGCVLNDCDLTENLGGGAGLSVLNNCRITGNQSWSRGAGASASFLTNCTVRSNWAQDDYGGGVSESTVMNCLIEGNRAFNGGGAYGSTLYSSILAGNSAGGGGGACRSALHNCVLTRNLATNYIAIWGAAGGGGAADCALTNCTLTANMAGLPDSPTWDGRCGGVLRSTLVNCLVYSNLAAPGTENYDSDSILDYCCTTPMPTNGIGNITNSPLFTDSANGNLHLQSTSPCVNAGNNSYVATATDLDGRPRIVDGAVDIGAYEYRALLVSPNSPAPTPPYATWATAATNIQDAVDAALAGDEIVVTNGLYATGGRTASWSINRLEVDKPLSLRSVNGPQFTVIDGGGTNRCVLLAEGASLTGFTLTNGFCDQGGGVWAPTNAFLTNCILTGNLGWDGGGICGGILYNCALLGNTAPGHFSPVGPLGGSGGGAYLSTLHGCTLSSNSANGFSYQFSSGGGGAYSCSLYACTLIGNSAETEGGGVFWSRLVNCTLSGNSANQGGGAAACTLTNCTVVGNSATWLGGGVSMLGHNLMGYFCEGELYNCIVYSNTAPEGPNYADYIFSPAMNSCCTTPLPTNGVANITDPPLFVDLDSGDLRLQPTSPCINSGNNAYVTTASDLDGNPRVVSGTADIGAYEYQGAGSVISYAWLQQFGLPTDGSGDNADPDHDGMNSRQEWHCSTSPTNAKSALRLLLPSVIGTRTIVTWESVDGVSYSLERSTNVTSAFMPLATGIIGRSGTTSYSDADATGADLFYYRVGVNYP